MKFTRETSGGVAIRRVERGRIAIVDGRGDGRGEAHYERTVALSGDGVIEDLGAPGIEELGVEHLGPLLDSQPEILVIGTGWAPSRPPADLAFAMARRGIGLEVMDTPAACRTFNILIAEGRRPAALLVID